MRVRNAVAFSVLLLLSATVFSGEVDPAFEALAKRIERDARKQDVAAVSAAHDLDAFCRRVHGNATADKEFFAGFVLEYKKSAEPGEMMCRYAEQGDLSFLRMRSSGEDQLALFRNANGFGVQYIELLLQKDKLGKAVVADCYPYMLGEYVSQSLQFAYRAALREANPTAFSEVVNEKLDVERLEKLLLMMQQSEGREFQAVLDTFKTIPPASRGVKTLHMMRVNAAREIDDKTLLEAIEDFERAFPGDRALALLKIDAYQITNDQTAALKSVDALEKAVGGDPFLNVLRADMNIKAGRIPTGVALAREAADQLPEMLFAQASYLHALLTQKDYATAVKFLDRYEQKFGWNDAAIAQDEHFAPFLASKEYTEWKAQRKPAKP